MFLGSRIMGQLLLHRGERMEDLTFVVLAVPCLVASTEPIHPLQLLFTRPDAQEAFHQSAFAGPSVLQRSSLRDLPLP